MGLLIGQRNLLANDQQLARQSIALCDKAIRGMQDDPARLEQDAMCEDNTLAKDLLLSSDMAGEGTLTTTENSSQRVKTFSVTSTGISIERTIKSESSTHNLLKGQYSILSNSFPNSTQSTTLMIPAQAWCRS